MDLEGAWPTPIRLPVQRVLHVADDGSVIGSRGYQLLRSSDWGAHFTPIAHIECAWSEAWPARVALAARLARLGLHTLVRLSDGTTIATVRGRIVRSGPEEEVLGTAFRVPRDTRPLNLGVGPNDTVVFGEYFHNTARAEVHVYGSHDRGRSWTVWYTFPAGSIRHVHNVLWDPYREAWLVLTGDEDRECQVLRTRDFLSFDTLINGAQRARAVTAIPTAEGLYLPMDSPLETNFVHFLGHDGRLDRLFQLEGSCFSALHIGPWLCFSTAVEPSRVNTSRDSTLVVWNNALATTVYRGRKDRWPWVFQYANLFFPTGGANGPYLFATAIAQRGADLCALRWHLPPRQTEPSPPK